MKDKFLVCILTMALCFSVLALDIKPVQASVPGFNEWGLAVDELMYDNENYVDVELNTSTLNIADYFVMYPVYDDGIVTWSKVMAGGSPVLLEVTDNSYDATKELSSSILLNVSGMWVVSQNGSYDGTYQTDYFWVNSTEAFGIELTTDEITYGYDEELSIIVTEGEDSASCWIDLIKESTGQKIFHRYEPDGMYTFDSDWENLMKWAGNYTVQAYKDIDDQFECGYGTGKGYYDDEYGLNLFYTNYNYTNCGPWDIPEHIAENEMIVVKTGEPKTSIDKHEVVWSFDEQINISVEDYNEEGIPNLNVKVFNNEEIDITGYLIINIFDDYILIKNGDPANTTAGGWGRHASGLIYGDNGSWYITIYKDVDFDGNEEWNTTIDFNVLSPEGTYWKWITDDKIEEIPPIHNQPLEVQFQIVGDDHTFYGDQATSDVEAPNEYGENITIEGNCLFTGALNDIPGVSYQNGIWSVLITPTMDNINRKISFYVDWEDYGTLYEELPVGGTDHNGSIISITPSTFVIDENVTLQVSVFGPDDYPITNANVYLYWMLDNGTAGTMIKHVAGADEAGQNIYSFSFNITEQNDQVDWLTVEAPRNILVYTDVLNVGYGYTKATMKPKSDLVVNVSKDIIMAGEKTKFNVDVSAVNGDISNDPIQIDVYDSEGEMVTLDGEFGTIQTSDLDNIINELNDYIIKPGVYTLYAHNATHDSEGNNGTLEVKSVDITCDKAPFIWQYDDNISATFTVKYQNQPVNGTLKIYNVDHMTDYYSSWIDTGDNAVSLSINNGVGTLHNISADTLPLDSAEENITFKFKPKTSGSNYAETEDKVFIRIPDVVAIPKFMAYNQPAEVTITVTGRQTTLEDIYVSLKVPGLEGKLNAQTSSEGTATFAFVPLTTGDVIIQIENRTSDTTILVTSWSLHIDVQTQVNENTPFLVTIRNNSIDGEILDNVEVIFDGKTRIGDYIFTAPKVTSDTDYTISVKKDGYASDAAIIKVVNVPVLQIICPSEVNARDTFTIVISDDTGKVITGALVTIADKNYTTTSGGSIQLTAPEQEGNYVITASFGEYTDAAPIEIKVKSIGTPGFELILLIGAIAISLVIMKRRLR